MIQEHLSQPETWKDVLNSLKKGEKQHIIHALGIQERTLSRWIHGETDLPHLSHLQMLIHALPPAKRVRFLEIVQDDPAFVRYWHDLPFSNSLVELSASFYSLIMAAYTSSNEDLRLDTVCVLILFHATALLDAMHFGLHIAVVLYTPPTEKTGRVRSLTQRIALGTPPWSNVVSHNKVFYGQEFLHKTPLSIQQVSPDDFAGCTQNASTASIATFPIEFQGRRGGYMYIRSTQPDFFDARKQKIINQYCHLLVLALKHEDFYGLQQIELDEMPPVVIQRPYLVQLQQRISRLLNSEQGKDTLISWREAEKVVLQQLEGELLNLVCTEEAKQFRVDRA